MNKLLSLLGLMVTASTCCFGQTGLTNVTTGTLKLWLRADAGVLTAAGGRVTQWQDGSAFSNHTFQADSNNQPILVQNALNGKPVLRFDGIQDGETGDYLASTNNVATPTAFTSFLVCLHNGANISEQVPVLIGSPGENEHAREYYIQDGKMAFSAWGNDYVTGFYIPTNAYRVWEFRMNTNLSHLEYFDTTGSTFYTNTVSTSGIQEPRAGFYIGGLGEAGRNIKGDIAEFILYSGALSEADRVAVENYLLQKYLPVTPVGPAISQHPTNRTLPTGTNTSLTVVATGTAPLSYQWYKDGNALTNNSLINGATGSTLVLSNLTTSVSGVYNVVVSNAVSSVTSSNATLSVLTPVAILTQPASQAVVAGTNVEFQVVAQGDQRTYQWTFNENAIPAATNSSLLLTNVQSTTAGRYAVVVSNPVGVVTSSSAILSISSTAPVIQVHPADVSTVVGSTATFSVGLAGILPPVSSGILRLWLKADTGVVQSGGLVSQWIDQSGFNNSCFQPNTSNQPAYVTNGLNGQPALRFDGIQNSATGDYLQGSGQLGISNAFTSFIFYKRDEFNNGTEKVPLLIGTPGQPGAAREHYIQGNQMAFSAWANDYVTSFSIPSNTYRVWSFRLNSSKTLVEFFDTDGTSNYSTSRVTSISGTPSAGYYVGGLGTQTRNLKGDIAEILVYQGALANSERSAVEYYLKTKYFSGSATSSEGAYQWFFEGVAISGATNASLTLTNVQSTHAGSYYVTVSNSFGSVTSSNALLTIAIAPSIISGPSNQSVNIGSSATLFVDAAGTPPLSYVWKKNGSTLSTATNSSLTFNPVQTSDAGNYFVIVSNPWGSITSAVASVTVNVTSLRIPNTSAMAGAAFTLPVEINALGHENALGFSVNFNPALISFSEANLGTGASNAVFIVNTNQASSGKLGFALALPANTTITAGTQQIAGITFIAAFRTNAINTPITFGDQPTLRQVSDTSAGTLAATYNNGNVSLTASELEADVSPRPNGNYSVTITDWVQVGRFVAGLDSFFNASEFQRTDCAPRSTQGNGAISVTDWVQAGRFASGVDPISAVGGPTGLTESKLAGKGPIRSSSGGRTVELAGKANGQTNEFAVTLLGEGNENALGFSVTFNPSILSLTSATVVGAPGAIVNLNTNHLASGSVGVALALPTGNTFAAGANQLLLLRFISQTNVTMTADVTFGNSPVVKEISDAAANSLSAIYSASSIVINPPVLEITQNGNSILLEWPTSDLGFILENRATSSNIWTTVTNALSTNGSTIKVTLPAAEDSMLYRLKK